ncbi:hypothetical protein E4U39_006369, partial [Claviceps sp. Clav50 group G5]
MSSIDALDAQSKAQLQSYIQKAVRDGLVATEQRLAQSESLREQQASQLAELNTTLRALQAAAAAQAPSHPVATQSRPPPMRTLFDGTTSQFR